MRPGRMIFAGMDDERETLLDLWASIGGRLLRSLVPVLLTYPVALFFLLRAERESGAPPPSPADELQLYPPDATQPVFLVVIILVALLTMVFAIMPLALLMTSQRHEEIARKSGISRKTIAILFIGSWYSFPYLAIAFAAHPLVLAGAILNIVLARRGTRAWVFIEYSVVSISLFAYLIACGPNHGAALTLSPVSIGAASVQIAILALADRLWRERFIHANDDSDAGEGPFDPSSD